MACVNQIIQGGPWETEDFWPGQCGTCTADVENMTCDGYRAVPEPDGRQSESPVNLASRALAK